MTRVHPIAFSESGEMWGSNGKFYFSSKNWWELDSENWTEDTDIISLKQDSIYRVIGITDAYCFASQEPNGFYYQEKNNSGWRSTGWSTSRIIKQAIFVPTSEMFGEAKEKTVDKLDKIVLPRTASKPDWFKLPNNICYFCGTSGCEHLTRLSDGKMP